MSTPATPEELWRRRFDRLVPTVFLVALAFVQRPGWIAADTKLDLHVDPGGFLARALSLWDPLAAGGQLQNQAYGYLFPMGPFFWLGHALHLPAWVVQRLWWALILLLAYHGTLLVLERLGIGTGWSRIIGAFTYAVAPRMLVGLGAISSEIWPMAVAPWVLLPLLAVQPGRERGAGLRSGLAVLALGAVNAVATMAALVLPLWWILTRRGPVRLRLLGWWSLAVVLATAWWIGPLLLLGRYSPPFLDWIEDARVTTSVAGVGEALRGSTQWIAAIGGERNAVWPAGWVVLTSRNVILLGLVVVLVGLLGLALARGPWATFARGGLLVGLFLVTFGHIGAAVGPWAGLEADLLDGVLAPLRNTHKLEPALRLPIALGVAHALPLSVTWLRRMGAPWPRLVPALVVTALVGQTAAAAFLGVVQRGAFLAVPTAWQEAATWLEAHPDGGRALLLPGGNAPARLWGEPKDEPLQPVASEPWLVRDAVPLGSAGATRLLDEVEARVAQGRGGPELVALLRTLGVTRVLLVADHQRLRSSTTPPVVVRAALTSSGATSVAAFGDPVGGSTDVTLASDWGLDRPLRAIEVFDVDTGSTIAPTELLRVPDSGRYSGGPEGFGALPERGPGVFAADDESALPGAAGPAVATDSLQRRQASFATATDLYGPLLAADEEYPSPRAVHDYWPEPLDEDDPSLTGHQTVRQDDGGARARASSSLAEPALGQGRELASDAWRAFDRSGETGWRSAGFDPRGQWVEAGWADPVELPERLDLTLDTSVGADVAAVTIRTDAGSLRTPVTSPDDASGADRARYVVPVEVPRGATRSLRLVVEAARGDTPTVRVLDIGAGAVPRVEPWVRLPATVATPDVVSLQQATDDRPACYPMSSGVLACSPDRRRVGEEAFGLRRVLTLDEPRSWVVRGAAVASGEGADSLLRRLDGVRASASSRWFPEPGVSPELTVDGDPRTYWAADPADASPTLTVRWPTQRRVTGLRLETDPDVAGRRPTRVDVTVAGRTVSRAVGRDGVVTLPATQTRGVRLVVTETTTQESLTASGKRTMPVVLGEVALLGDPWPVPSATDQRISVPCGFGPTVQVGGRTVATSVETTRSRVLTGADGALRSCDGAVRLGAGEQRVQAVSSGEFAVRSLVLEPPAEGRTSGATSAGPVEVTSWGATRRSVELTAPAEEDTLLVVRENANPGWVATVSDGTLRPVRIDGWAQAWVVPAGTTGTVTLRFAPQQAFVASLVVGGMLALALVLLALFAPASWPSVALPGLRWSAPGRVLAVLVVVAVGGLAGAVAAGAALVVRRSRWWWLGPALAGVAATVWVGWSLVAPWPMTAATNRDLVSGGLGLFLVALATTWGGHHHPGRTRAATRPGLHGRLEDVPADGRDGEGGGEGEQDRHPEPVLEDVQAQGRPDREHQGQVPEEHAVADRADVGEHPRGQQP